MSSKHNRLKIHGIAQLKDVEHKPNKSTLQIKEDINKLLFAGVLPVDINIILNCGMKIIRSVCEERYNVLRCQTYKPLGHKSIPYFVGEEIHYKQPKAEDLTGWEAEQFYKL